jgi:hypothetical protein
LFFLLIVFLDSNEIRKSNVIAISLPLEMPVKGPITDRHFPYITINGEATPADIRLESRFTVLYNIKKCLNTFKIIKFCCFLFLFMIEYRSSSNNYIQNENQNNIFVCFFLKKLIVVWRIL